MEYFTDTIYQMVGRDDEVALLYLAPDSYTSEQYGEIIAVVFIYTPKIREKFEINFRQQINERMHDYIKIRYLSGANLTNDQIESLEEKGILSSDIIDIFYGHPSNSNLYYSHKTRKIQKLKITYNKHSNDDEHNLIYGFYKKMINDGIGLCPDELNSYYAMKLYFDPEKISILEKLLIFPNGELKSEIELKLIELKIERDNSNENDLKRFEYLYENKGKKAFKLISEELISAGSSLKILFKKNRKLLWLIYQRMMQFEDIRLNVMGKKAIYLDAERFLHIFFGHVSEFKVSDHFNVKDRFQWEEKEIIWLISAVITDLDEEIQSFWLKEPNKRFQLYGEKSYYFQGDYYSLYVEENGRLSTFFKIKKNI